MRGGTTGLVHTLTIPSIVSVKRKVRHDTEHSLRAMHDFHRRQTDGSNPPKPQSDGHVDHDQ